MIARFAPRLLTLTLILINQASLRAQEKEGSGHVCDGCEHHFVSPFISSGTGAEKILLRNRILQPSENADFSAVSTPSTEARHLILQFQAGTIDDGLKALKERGVEILQWVPNYAVSVRVPAGVDLAGIAEVRWAGPLQASDKLSAYLDPAAGEQHAIVDLFPGVNRKTVAAKMEALKIKDIPNLHLGKTSLLVNATPAELEQIAKLDGVAYVFPASKPVIANEPVKRCPGPMTPYGPMGAYVTNGEGWEGQGQNPISLTYHFRNGTPDMTGEQTIVVNALNIWSNYAQITWTNTGGNNLNRSMDIQWGPHPDYPFDGPSGTLAYCFYPSPPNSETIAGDMYFDEGETWSNGGATDIFSVALHEAGHGLGLNHSDDVNAVMYPYYSGAVTDLRPDDIAGIRALYASTGGGGGGGGGGGDSFEPDDTVLTAKPITNNSGQSHSINPVGDNDFVYFDLPSSATVTIETDGPSGDTVIYLFNSTFNSVESDDDDGNGLFSRIQRTLSAGRYYLAVEEYNNNGLIPSYTLTLNHNATSGGDGFEPDNTAASAGTITSGATQNRSIVPATDIDYARFSLTQTSDVTITTSGAAGNDTRMWLFGSNLSTIEFDDDDGTNLFSLIDRLDANGDALAAGTYYILIDEFNNDDQIAAYTLNLQVAPVGGGGGGDDSYEPNNFLNTSHDPGFNWERTWLSAISGPGIQSDDDFYKIDVFPAGFERVLADLRFNHSQGDIDLILMNGAGNELTRSESETDDESLNYVVPSSNFYYLYVYFGDAGNSYDLWWDDISPSTPGDFPPHVGYLFPNPGSKMRRRQTHIGTAFDDKGVVLVQTKLPRYSWKNAAYSNFIELWTSVIKKNKRKLKNRRWVRVQVRAIDTAGQRDATSRKFRRY